MAPAPGIGGDGGSGRFAAVFRERYKQVKKQHGRPNDKVIVRK
jgi:hypothetical protein